MEIVKARYGASSGPIKPRKRWHRFTAVGIILVLLLSSGGYTIVAASKPLPELSVTQGEAPVKLAAKIALPWPETGQAAVGSLE
ncbi:MAG: hypothetical protein M3Q14_03850, partial [bacterium]|nr:hypothetical protein [bacterium]